MRREGEREQRSAHIYRSIILICFCQNAHLSVARESVFMSRRLAMPLNRIYKNSLLCTNDMHPAAAQLTLCECVYFRRRQKSKKAKKKQQRRKKTCRHRAE